MLQNLKEIKQVEEKMKIIEVDEELYQYIASQTQSIGESASDILRRLLNFSNKAVEKTEVPPVAVKTTEPAPTAPQPAVQAETEAAFENPKVLPKNNLMSLFSKWSPKFVTYSVLMHFNKKVKRLYVF